MLDVETSTDKALTCNSHLVIIINKKKSRIPLIRVAADGRKKKEGPSNEDAGCQIFHLFLGGALAGSVSHKRPDPPARFLRVRAYIKGANLLRRTQ